MIIDIHTHIYDEERYRNYFNKAKGRISKALVLHWCKFNLTELLNLTATKDNLYVAGSIDINGNIQEQLEVHQKLFQEKKIFGIKLYPGYQYFYPSDEKIYPIAELCQKYNKPLIFHSGDVYDPDKTAILKYSHPIHIDGLAVKFPDCKIIISHFGFPYHVETANVVYKNKNVYTDVSGTLDALDTKQEEKDAFKQYVNDIKRAIAYFPDVKTKTMFGSDYGGEDTPLHEIEPYIKFVNTVFPKENRDLIFYKLAEKLFFAD